MMPAAHYFAKLPSQLAYPVSKTALNALTVQYAKALAADGRPGRPTGGFFDDDGEVPW